MIIRVTILPQTVKHFESYGDFFQWLKETHGITREGFFDSDSYRCNEDHSWMRIVLFNLVLTVERQDTLEESKL